VTSHAGGPNLSCQFTRRPSKTSHFTQGLIPQEEFDMKRTLATLAFFVRWLPQILPSK
jgi:hypothetical protein